MLKLDAQKRTDDPSYIGKVQRIINGAIAMSGPDAVSLIRLDGWFGPRWFGFSRKVMGAFGVAYHDTLVVPPFVPRRVTKERTYRKTDSSFVVEFGEPPIHISQTSESNRHRNVHKLYPRRAFFWWSGGSADSGRGAVMAYLPTPDSHIGWYAALVKDGIWRWADWRRITLKELEALERPPSPALQWTGASVALRAASRARR